jgi:hypothetical protein
MVRLELQRQPMRVCTPLGYMAYKENGIYLKLPKLRSVAAAKEQVRAS